MEKKMRNLYSRMMNRSKKAFTLFEIVVVLAIITIVSAVIIPSFYNIGDRIEADKQMVEVKNVFLATDSIVDRYSDIEEARNTLFRDGRPHENLVKELASLTEIPVSTLEQYEFSIDDQDRLVVKYKDFAFNGADDYRPEGGGVAVKPIIPPESETPPVIDENLVPEDSEWAGTEDGKFKYIGTKTTVAIPERIKGVLVTSYRGMFEGTSVNKVISINPAITDMSYMFSDSRATTLDLSELYTANVTKMSYMFHKTNISTLDLSKFNTARVNDMEGMFYNSRVQNLDISSFNTSNVRNMSYMFNIEESFTPNPILHLDLSSLDTSKVTNMRSMLKNRKEVIGYAKSKADADRLNESHDKPANLRFITIANDDDFQWVADTVNGYSMVGQTGIGYYRYNGALNEVAIPRKINGTPVTHYNRMFYNTTVNKVVSTNPNIISMAGMFHSSKASTIYLEEINTTNVISMKEMFASAATVQLSGFTNFNTSKVTDMSGMFKNSKLTPDFSKFNTANVVNMSNMFENYIGPVLDLSNFNTTKVTNTTNMFLGAKSTKGYVRTQADANKLNASSGRPSTLYFVVLAKDADFTWVADATNGYTMPGQTGTGYWKYGGQALELELPLTIYGVPVTRYNRMFTNSAVRKVISPNPNIVSTKGMFYGSTAPYIDLSGLNTINVTDMSQMFYGVSASSIDMTGFNTAKVTNMSGMFQNAKGQTYNLLPLNTSSVTNMSSMFQGSSLTSLEITHFNTAKVSNISNMFYGYKGQELRLSSFDTSLMTNTTNAFATTVAVRGYARNQADADRLNASAGKPSTLNFVVMATDADFSGDTNGNFVYIGTAKELEIPHVIKGVNVTSYKNMFKNSTVRRVVSSNPNITDMSYMFDGTVTDTLNLTQLNTSNTRNFGAMFYRTNIQNLDISTFDTSRATSMSSMFNSAKTPTIDISNFNTIGVTNMGSMFYNSTTTTVIGLENLNTSNVTTMSGMFRASYINDLNLNNWDTSKVTNMASMFYSARATNISVSNFVVSKVTDMSSMFRGTLSIQIDISKWDTSLVSNMSYMFSESMATFTGLESLKTAGVTNFDGMFASNKKITSLDLSAWNTGNALTMNSMFNDASNLTTLNVNNWNTANLTGTSGMFLGTKISTFNLTSWDTTKITSSANMFYGTPGTVGFARTQADADKLNATSGKPAALIFGIPKNVKFIVDGTTVSNLTIATGNVIPAPTDPVKAGHTFMGWFTTTAATGGTQWTPSLTVSDNIVFYARWQIQQRTFTFNANNGTAPSPATITKDYGSTVGTLPTTSRTGYTFLGWFTATSGGTKLTTSTPMTSDTTYYAQWQIQTRTFTFNANGGNTPSPATITKDYGSTVGTLPTVTREGYILTGWFTAASGGTKLTTGTTMTTNTTYYAQWIPDTRTFTFDGNGGGTPNPVSITKTYNTAVGTLPTVSRTGYTFLGWFTATSGGTQLQTTTLVTENRTYYAQWSINSYTVTFNANGGSGDSTKSVVYNTAVGTLPTPTRTGYTFNGWYTAASGGEAVSTSTVITENVTYYAQWTVNNYTVTFNGNGGSNGTSKTVAYGSAVGTLPTVSRTGYTFKGWYTAASGGTAVSTSTIVYGDVTYYAQWTINNYTVTFNGNNGSNGASKTVTYGSAVGTLPSSSRTGYTFQGWYTAASGGTKISTSTIVYGDVTYYAQWTVNNYTVTFDGNGGSNGTSKSVAYGSAVGTLPSSSRTGYTFKGWYTAASGGTEISTSTIVYGDVTYYAQWTVNNYTFTFNGNGGGTPNPVNITKTYNTAVGTLPTVSRTGYTLTGWFTATSGGTQLQTTTPITENRTYYAQWSINSYTVTFNANGGSGDSTKSVVYNTAVGALPTPTRTGYTFNGWYTAASGGTAISTSTVITENVTYYAQWTVNNYTFTFNGNGGGTPNPVSITKSYNTAVGTLPAVSRTGYTFTGWFTATSGGTQLQTTTLITGNVTYYAQWSINSYTVTFNANGGSGDSTRSVAYNTAVGALPTPTRTGYTFNGWFTATSGGTQLQTTTLITGNVTYYAQWTANNYTVTFNANGGSGGTTKSVAYNTAVGTLPTPTRTGYTFTGWFTATSGGTQLQPTTLITGNVTYYAQWSINSYTVTFNANGGSGGSTKSVVYNTAVGTLPTPTRTGYTFTGWFTATSGGEAVSTSTVITGNVTYYAQWTVNNYTFTFNGNGGGTPSPASITKAYNTAVGTLPTVSRTGYTFKGWFTATSGGTQLQTTTPITGDVTYYAQWTVNNYTVTFNGNSGSNGTSKSVAYGSTVGTLPSSSRTGYTFNGWYTAASGGTKISTSTIVYGDVTYYAQWAVNTYTVTFNGNGGSDGTSKTVAHGSEVGTLPTSVRTGYTFNGWYTAASGGTEISTTTKITGNVTYYAQWTVSSYTVTFDANGGSGGETRSVEHGQTLGTLPTPTRSGHKYFGWTTTSSSINPSVTPTQTISSNATYYAVWMRTSGTFRFNSGGAPVRPCPPKGCSNGLVSSITLNQKHDIILMDGYYWIDNSVAKTPTPGGTYTYIAIASTADVWYGYWDLGGAVGF